MMKTYDIVALGESLVDFVTVKGEDPAKIYLEGNAGGAPSNVLAMAAKLGRGTAFIGKVGRDAFGSYLKERIRATGVDVSGMSTGGEPTTLAMVSLDEKGNRSFSFYRNQTADVMLRPLEVEDAFLENCRIFHFGSVSLTSQPACGTTLQAVQKAKAAGAKISFDPNYRPFLWENQQDAVAAITQGLELADYVKLSDEEAMLVGGQESPEKAALTLMVKYGFTFMAVTLGPKGCLGLSSSARVSQPTYDVETLDTTGAGDAFWGAVLHQLLELEAAPIDEKALKELLCFGNAAGSLVTTAHGAIAPQPTEKEIRACMKKVKLLV